MADHVTTLSDWLREHMESRQPRLSIRMLARESGVPRTVIGAILRYREHRPEVRNLARLADFFEVDMGLLWRLSWGRPTGLSPAEPARPSSPPQTAEDRVLATLTPAEKAYALGVVNHAEGLNAEGRASGIRSVVKAYRAAQPRAGDLPALSPAERQPRPGGLAPNGDRS